MPQPSIVPIVEGDGEVHAVPLLLRRLLEVKQRFDLQIARPKKTGGRQGLEKRFEQFLRYARKEPNCAGSLVLLDADKDCASEVAVGLAKRAQSLKLPFPVVIVCAKCEYEAWFLASLETITSKHRGLKPNLTYDKPVEELLGIKEWLTKNMLPGHTYKETEDQPSMTQLMDFESVRQRSRSFRRLEHALEELLNAMDNASGSVVTPSPSSIADRSPNK